MATYRHKGDSIPYTPGSDVTAGDVVVQNELVGVATQDIAANELGSLAVDGVFDFPKATGGGTAIAAGLDCYWDAGAGQAGTDAGSGGSNKYIGRSIAAAADADATVRIRMSQ